MQILAIAQSVGGGIARFPSVISEDGAFQLPLAGSFLPPDGCYLIHGNILLIGNKHYLALTSVSCGADFAPFAHCVGTALSGNIVGTAFKKQSTGGFSGTLVSVWGGEAAIVGLGGSGVAGIPCVAESRKGDDAEQGDAAPVANSVTSTTSAPVPIPAATVVLEPEPTPVKVVEPATPVSPPTPAKPSQQEFPGFIILSQPVSEPFPFSTKAVPGLTETPHKQQDPKTTPVKPGREKAEPKARGNVRDVQDAKNPTPQKSVPSQKPVSQGNITESDIEVF